MSVAERICFHYYFHEVNYVKALACLPDNKTIDAALLPKVLWAYCQLGLYGIVRQFNYSGAHWRGQYANIVSLAACGDFEKSAIALKAFQLSEQYTRYQKSLAEAIAPFNASLALAALQSSAAHPLLYAALLLRLNKYNEAAPIIQSWGADECAIQPETYLLSNTIKGLSSAQKLTNLNAFLRHYGLAPIALKQATLAASVTNIQPVDEVLCKLKVADTPLVSVIMTAFNAADFITSAVESILAQSYKNIELIIVDDASEDATADVAKALASMDMRIKYLRLPCNAGTYVAKTLGLQHAKGEFVTCHDSDDWAHPQRIELQMQPLMQNKKLVATISDWVRLDEQGIPYARGVFPLMRLNPASPLFRRSIVLEKTGAWDLVRTGADSEFIARLKLVFGRKSVKRIRLPLVFGAHRAGSLMTAADTGYSGNLNNNARQHYREAWGNWHITLTQQGKTPFMHSRAEEARPFATQPSVQVAESAIQLCLTP